MALDVNDTTMQLDAARKFGALDAGRENAEVDSIIQLVTQAQEGDQSAFEELYHTYVKAMHRYVYYRVPSEDRSDLVSEIFLRVWHKLNHFSGGTEAQFKGWMYTIAHNLIVDLFRKSKKNVSLDEAEFLVCSDPDKSPEVLTKQQLQLETIALHMKSLPVKQQEVITLRFFQDLPYEEIAHALGTSEGNVRIILHRALKKLKDEIESASS